MNPQPYQAMKKKQKKKQRPISTNDNVGILKEKKMGVGVGGEIY